MAATKKDYFVGKDQHKWWKEAVVYQARIRNEPQDHCSD
jgi:hypothetical protein